MRQRERDHPAITKDVRSALKMGLVFALLVMLLQIALSGWLMQHVFKSPPLLRIVLITNALALPFSVLTLIAASATQGFKLLKYKVFVTQILNPLLLLLTMLATFILFAKDLTIILPTLLSAVVGAVVIMRFLRQLTGAGTTGLLQVPFNREILIFSYPLMFTTVIGTIMHWTDILMLGYFTDTASVGLYHPAVRTAGLLRAILLSFGGIFAPIMSQLFSEGKQGEMRGLYRLVTRWILTLALPITLIFLFMPAKVMLLFGPDYQSGAPVLVVLALATFTQAMLGLGGPTLTMTGHPNINLINALIAATVNIALNVLLIPRFGIIGAAYATLISIVLIGIIRLVEIWYLVKLFPFHWKLIKPLVAGGIAGIVLRLVAPTIMPFHTIVTLLLAGAVTFTTFALVLWVMRLDDDDREVWKALRLIGKTGKKWI
jgi:O-antigen/teichoic acid export membrane protein